MSEIKLISDVMPELLPMQGRSPGVHVSSIISRMCIALGHFKDDGKDLPKAYMELGCALEHAIIQRFALDDPDRYQQPGELELDNMFGTPDLLDLTDEAVIEIKLTWMSSNHEPDSQKFWRYWVQLKAYCKMMGWPLGRLHVCHIVGDWRGSGPIYRVWECKFDREELDDNWFALQTNAEIPE